MQKAKFSSKRTQKCPDIGSIHKKYVYEDSKRSFQLLGDVANGLLISNEYKNKDITEDTKVCRICYEKLKKICEEICKEAGESTPAEVNEILTRNKFSLSPFKLPSSVDATSLPNYVNRKRKQLLDTFYEETDCKIRKLYDVSRQKLEFNECKIRDEWNENLSLVLEMKI